MVGLTPANSLSVRGPWNHGRAGRATRQGIRRGGRNWSHWLVAVVAAAILITVLFQVTFLQPILATPLAFADPLAIVLGASYVITFRLVARRRSNGRAS
jgi:hypothetical protein